MLTAYDYPTAKILDEAGVDSILVGDSLGMVVLGYEDTTRVTMDDMVHHTKAVVRGVKRQWLLQTCRFYPTYRKKRQCKKCRKTCVRRGLQGCKT